MNEDYDSVQNPASVGSIDGFTGYEKYEMSSSRVNSATRRRRAPRSVVGDSGDDVDGGSIGQQSVQSKQRSSGRGSPCGAGFDEGDNDEDLSYVV